MSHRVNLCLLFIANIVRYYNYSLFALSATSLSKNFVYISDEYSKLSAIFFILALSALARPLGAIFFGVIARYNRLNAIKIATLYGALSTIFIAFIPSYHTIGILSTIIVFICRAIFVFSLAGETDILRIYITDILPHKKFLRNGLLSACSQLGVLIAAIIYNIFVSFDQKYLWRMSFVIGGGASLVLFYLRYILFKQKSNIHNEEGKYITLSCYISSFISAFRDHKINFVRAILFYGFLGSLYHFFIIFLTNMSDVHIDGNWNIIIYMICSIFAGYVAHIIHWRVQIISSLVISIIFFIIGLYCYKHYIYVIAVALLPFYYVPLQVIQQRIFSKSTNYIMCSTSHALGSVLFSSTTPLILTNIWKATHSIIYINFFAIFILVVLLMLSCSVIFSSKSLSLKEQLYEY